MNAYCMFERKAWLCSMCGTRTELEPRYATSQQRASLEEMQRGIVDLLEECVEVDNIYSDDLKPEERPAVIAVMDMSGSEEFVEVGSPLPAHKPNSIFPCPSPGPAPPFHECICGRHCRLGRRPSSSQAALI